MTKEDAINLKETLDTLIVGLNGFQKEIEGWVRDLDGEDPSWMSAEDKEIKRSLLKLSSDIYYAGYKAAMIKQEVEQKDENQVNGEPEPSENESEN